MAIDWENLDLSKEGEGHAKPITLKELNEWIKKNKKRTWFLKEMPTTFEVKYLRFSLDTRTMTIFNIQTESFKNLTVDYREKFDGTILDLLDHKLEKK